MIDLPTDIAHIKRLITDKVQEDLHLDYKDSDALDKNNRHEISKDVSSFANSDGGIIIYGIAEKDNLPVIGDVGVDHARISRETLENIITSNISPRVDNVIISQIQLSATNSIFAVQIPRSDRAPHQAKDRKYYKRFNFKSEAMEDYEINDVRNRRIAVLPLINIFAEIRNSRMVYIKISNVGSMPALDVSFSFPEMMLWARPDNIPSLITNGTKYFPPNKTFNLFWNTTTELFQPQNRELRKINAAAAYLHPHTNQYVSDTFQIDLEDFRGNSTPRSDVSELKDLLKNEIPKLTTEIKNLNRSIESLLTIAGSSGLDLSITTLRNIKNIISGDGNLEKVDPNSKDSRLFQEVLNIDENLAYKLEMYFSYYSEAQKLEEIENITPEIIEELRKHFRIDE